MPEVVSFLQSFFPGPVEFVVELDPYQTGNRYRSRYE